MKEILKILEPIIKEINVEKRKASKKGGIGNMFSGLFGGAKPAVDPDLTKEEYEVIENSINNCIIDFRNGHIKNSQEKENLVNAEFILNSLSFQLTKNIINHRIIKEKGYSDYNILSGREGCCLTFKDIKSSCRKSKFEEIMELQLGGIQIESITLVNNNTFITPLIFNINPELEKTPSSLQIVMNNDGNNFIKLDVVYILFIYRII